MTIFSSNPYTCPLIISLSPFSRTTIPVILINPHNPSLTIIPLHLSTLFPKPPSLIKPLRVSSQQKYIYPEPIPEFAEAETLKFRGELLKKLSTNKEFGGDIDNVVKACAEILNDFLHKEYGGPGTLLVEPFTDMFVALKEKNLPGAAEAARAALLWAQNYLDKDWEIWISQAPAVYMSTCSNVSMIKKTVSEAKASSIEKQQE